MRCLAGRGPHLRISVGVLGVLLAAPHLRAEALPEVRFDPQQLLQVGNGNDNQEQLEPSIAVSATNPLNLAAMFIAKSTGPGSPCKAASSSDGGLTWQVTGDSPMLAPNHGCGDPSVASDVDGGFYFGYLTGGATVVAVAKSNDGGRTFSLFSVAVPLSSNKANDKPYLAVDTQPGSRFRGSVYVAYFEIDFLDGPSSIRVVTSRDGGRTWTAPTTVSRQLFGSTGETLISPVPVVAPDGKVYVFYFDGTLFTGPAYIRFVSSSDGGRHWSKPVDATPALPTPIFFRTKNADPGFGTVPDAGAIGSGDPSVAITKDGTIFLVWADFPNGQCIDVGGVFDAACTNADVRMTVSRNGGRSWSAPVKVTDEVGATDQMFPWIAAHPDGLVSLMWLDKRLDPDNINFDIFYSNTRDGQTFLPNVRASSQTSEVGDVEFYGDYNNIAASSQAAFPIWTGVSADKGRHIFTTRGTLVP